MRKEQVSRADKIAEAKERMRMLNVLPSLADQLEKEGRICMCSNPDGMFSWVLGADRERIQQYEADDNILIYMAIRTESGYGTMDSFLFVSDYKDEWAFERDGTEKLRPCAYVYNRDLDITEVGEIGVKLAPNLGLIRFA